MVKCKLCGENRCRVRYHLDFADVYICPDCDVLFLHPQPDDARLSELYDNKDYFLKDYSGYFKDCLVGYSPEAPAGRDFQEVLDRVHRFKQPGELLDIGCATGAFLDMARKQGWKVKGVEFSSWASQYARENFKLDVFTGSLEAASFPSASFDVITALDVFEHLKDPVGFLAEVHRILRPEGLLVINTYYHKSILNYLGHLIYLVSLGRITYPLYRLFGVHHTFYFSGKGLSSLMARQGLPMIDLEMGEFAIDRIDKLDGLLKMGVRMVYWLQRHTGLQTSIRVIGKKATDC